MVSDQVFKRLSHAWGANTSVLDQVEKEVAIRALADELFGDLVVASAFHGGQVLVDLLLLLGS